jgi:hypothetical protein
MVAFPINYVVTLALGLRPRQRFARLQAKRGAGSHTTYYWECGRMWGNEPSHPKGVPLWRLEFRWIPEFSEGDCRGQNSMTRGIIYIIGKLLEHRWAHITHLDIWNTSYGQKKGRESNWQFDFRPLKVGNRPNFLACNILLKRSQQGLQLCFRPHFHRRSAHKVMAPQSHGSPNLSNFGTPTWEFWDKKPFRCGPCGQPHIIL